MDNLVPDRRALTNLGPRCIAKVLPHAFCIPFPSLAPRNAASFLSAPCLPASLHSRQQRRGGPALEQRLNVQTSFSVVVDGRNVGTEFEKGVAPARPLTAMLDPALGKKFSSFEVARDCGIVQWGLVQIVDCGIVGARLE
ncbi:hypothetical protein NHJ13051_002190 [Beauveria bassiana]